MAPDPGAEPDAQEGEDETPADLLSSDDAVVATEEKPRRSRSFWRDFAVIVVAALGVVILLKLFVVQMFSIPSGSMENTLLPGDRILVNRLIYHFRSIDRGDVVVFSGAGSWDPPTPPASNWFTGLMSDAGSLVGIAGPGTDYVKRVIGVPGDHVVCCNANGQVTVNGVPLSETQYIFPNDVPSQVKFNITVPAGRLWVMGDNRGDSSDSRYHLGDPGGGTIPESAVVGRAFLVIWPLSRVSDVPIPNTFKQAGFSAAAAASAAAPPVTAAAGAGLAGASVLTWRRRRRSRADRRRASGDLPGRAR